MKPPPFDYVRPASLDEALALLAEHGDDAKILAGGQSLLPLMSLRLARPATLIDIGGIPGLDQIAVADGGVSIGALVRHGVAERSAVLAESAPLVHQAMPHIGHRAIRTRGTVVGSIAHADPAAEMPAVCLATGATMVARSSGGEREIAAADFFDGYLTTVLQSDEILCEVRFPTPGPSTGATIVEFSRRHGDYAIVGLACSVTMDGSTISGAALSFFGAADRPHRVTAAEELLVGAAPSEALFDEVARSVSANLSPAADIHATAAYRRHLAGVLTKQGLAEATATIGAPA